MIARSSGPRAVIVICDSLRRDLIDPETTPFLVELSERAASFAAHRSVFPSTTRASAASIATGCVPARHGLLGNTMALDEGEGLICRSAGHPDFPDRLRRATGRTLHVPTLAERLRWHGETSISCANVSPGAAYFQDPDGHGWVYHAAGSYGPGRRPVDDPASAVLKKGCDGDRAMTERFCAEILEERAPSLAILWLSEPDYTGHHSPLGSPQHHSAIAGADQCARQVFETVRRLDPAGDEILFIAGSDHGMETVTRAIDLDALLIGAGLKQGPGSRDVVVAPNGTAATLYFADPDGAVVPRVARFLAAEDWVGEVFAGERLAAVGLPTNTAMRVAVTLASDDQAQSARGARLLPDRAGPGRQREQDRLRPAWRARPQRAAAVSDDRGRRVRARPAPRADLARRHRADRAAPPAHGPRRHGRPRAGACLTRV